VTQPVDKQLATNPITEVAVYLDESPGDPVYVGILASSYQGGRNLASSSFQYDRNYLARADRYELSPDLPLVASPTRTASNNNLFGAFADASPDAWGQKLVQANNAVQRKMGINVPRGLGDFDFLVGVSDITRMGALRLAAVGSGPTRAGDGWLSPRTAESLSNLDKALRIASRYEDRQASDDEIEYLAGIATSPGGARPKANVWQMGGRLALAKLPHSKDGNIDVEGWEAVALTIAKNAGVSTPRFEIERVSKDKSVLIVTRFDRHDVFRGLEHVGKRRGYMSAATALGIGKYDDNSGITYEQFADTIAEISSKATKDLREMYTRIALTVLVNNVDDHWRNHGFLRVDGGWRLSPVFDVNPSPRHGVIHSRAISDNDDPRNRDIRNVHAIADAYKLKSGEAAEIISNVAAKVREWPQVARSLDIPENQFEEIGAAFDEEQLGFAESLA
jgi:serine/threonine-protein kinase HipA